MIHPVKPLAFLTSFLCLNAITLPIIAQPQSKITLTIDGLNNKKGQICASLFASNKGFPSNGDDAVQKRCSSITEVPIVMTFENLQPGSYAIAVLHDANSDKTANRNALGIPTEGFGFSKNPAIFTGPPKFNEAAVVVAGVNTNINIKLQYLLGG
ncbi:conserved exported hypothetical protein [Planktothrix serta PCC 8927]|uniref:DUF2141 domain-containing protein n=1 Tax=Planktothrix serta PCC 8927 TaxID=671068 RepID=A0A7Z9BN70_9CYAN|nr:DUF2141 domain-containing protein [Planktothrix serta]VXD18101.1 conserved exported hypothetical protein [Planktothrix serta PCC 8927]